MTSSQTKIEVTVEVEAVQHGGMDGIVARLREAGLVVTHVAGIAHAVFGQAEPDMVEGLSRVDGVLNVRPSRTYQLPPMDEGVPQ
jgi:hypothetical protein